MVSVWIVTILDPRTIIVCHQENEANRLTGHSVKSILLSHAERHEENWAFPHSINSAFLSFSCFGSKVLRLDSLHSTTPPIAVLVSPTYPAQTAADSGGWLTMWPGSQPGVLWSSRRGTRRALRNRLTFQALLLFLAPCWVHVSFLATFLVLYVSGRRNCNRFQ